MPNARADRAMAPRFSGSLRPSSTAMRRAPATASATSAAAGGRRRRPRHGAGRTRRSPPARHGRRRTPGRRRRRGAPSKRASACGVTSTERIRWPDDSSRVDRRDALDDEQLVALDAPPGRRVGQLDVVGEPRIAGSSTGTSTPRSLAALTAPADRRDHRTHVREHVFPAPAGFAVRVRRARRRRRRSPGCAASTSTTTSWLDHAAGLAARRAGRVRPALARAAVAPAHGHDVGTPAARAAADVVVDAGRRGRAAAGPRRDAPACSAPTTASRSTRSASTATATATTRSPGTATATATRSTIRSSPSSASARARPFRLRPRGGGRALSFDLGRGDLFVMGGACQHDWEHCVPKVGHAEPRISITYRHGAR